MNFKKTLVTRAILHAILAILGCAVGIFAAKAGAEEAIMYFGFALAFASVLQFTSVIRLMRSPEHWALILGFTFF